MPNRNSAQWRLRKNIRIEDRAMNLHKETARIRITWNMHRRHDMSKIHISTDTRRFNAPRLGHGLLRAAGMLVLLTVATFTVSAAEQAEVTEVSGLVRIHDADGSWVRAEPGDSLTPNMAISTGFNGSAVLAIGASRVTVDSVSHVTVADLAQDAEKQDTTMDISFGRVRSEVKSTDNRETNFEVRSAVSTASVKGTDFVYDGSLLTVFEGNVSLQNRIGQSHSVRAGQRSRAYGYETIESVEAYFRDVADLGS